jgi:hypothetical protein
MGSHSEYSIQAGLYDFGAPLNLSYTLCARVIMYYSSFIFNWLSRYIAFEHGRDTRTDLDISASALNLWSVRSCECI